MGEEPLILTAAVPREWDLHLVGINHVMALWRKGELTDDGAVVAIRAYLKDRDSA